MTKTAKRNVRKSSEVLKKAGNRSLEEIIKIVKSIREETIEQNKYNERFL